GLPHHPIPSALRLGVAHQLTGLIASPDRPASWPGTVALAVSTANAQSSFPKKMLGSWCAQESTNDDGTIVYKRGWEGCLFRLRMKLDPMRSTYFGGKCRIQKIEKFGTGSAYLTEEICGGNEYPGRKVRSIYLYAVT